MKTARGAITIVAVLSVALIGFAMTAGAYAAEKEKGKKKEKKTVKLTAQKTCPECKMKLSKKVYDANAGGRRFYACSARCAKHIAADPKTATRKLAALGEKPEFRLTLCSKCGEIKGSKACCVKGAKKCKKCGLQEASLACCSPYAPIVAQSGSEGGKPGDFAVCAGCGDVKGSGNCCNKAKERCKKCGLNKGAPGCCKKYFLAIVGGGEDH